MERSSKERAKIVSNMAVAHLISGEMKIKEKTKETKTRIKENPVQRRMQQLREKRPQGS